MIQDNKWLGSETSWIIMILILLGYELWGASRKLDKIRETLTKILEQLEQRGR